MLFIVIHSPTFCSPVCFYPSRLWQLWRSKYFRTDKASNVGSRKIIFDKGLSCHSVSNLLYSPVHSFRSTTRPELLTRNIPNGQHMCTWMSGKNNFKPTNFDSSESLSFRMMGWRMYSFRPLRVRIIAEQYGPWRTNNANFSGILLPQLSWKRWILRSLIIIVIIQFVRLSFHFVCDIYLDKATLIWYTG